ncbi:hypothetical protein LTR12_007642, partial [Friedmanniomyces endolithicus]
AAGDPNLAWLAQKGITLENYFGVTHPSEPNYVSAVGGGMKTPGKHGLWRPHR